MQDGTRHVRKGQKERISNLLGRSNIPSRFRWMLKKRGTELGEKDSIAPHRASELLFSARVALLSLYVLWQNKPLEVLSLNEQIT